MAINVYNTKQQALNSKKIAELIQFCSNDFGGLVSTEPYPILFEDDTWYWNPTLQNTQATFIGGGVDIQYDVPASPTEDPNAQDVYPKQFNTTPVHTCAVWGLDVTIPDDKASIVTDNYGNASIVNIPCMGVQQVDLYIVVTYPSGNPHDKEYYEYDVEDGYVLSEDTSVQSDKTYFYRLQKEAFSVDRADFGLNQDVSFEYYGNTVWITDNRFFIPFCGISNNTPFPMIFNRDKTGYESFLTARTYYNLLAEFDKFVFRVGGPELGDIGDLNITGNTIKNRTDTYDSSGYNTTREGVMIDRPKFSSLINSTEKYDTDNTLLINNEGSIYKTCVNYMTPIKHGGTHAHTKDSARKNLGFFSGTGTPNNMPTRTNRTEIDTSNPNNPVTETENQPDYGAIYFKIIG